MNDKNIYQKHYQNIDKLLSFSLELDMDYTNENGENIRTLCSNIELISSAIFALPLNPSWQEEVTLSELVRGIGSTTGIEGNTLTQEQIRKAFEKAKGSKGLARADQEVVNSKDVFEFCQEWVENHKEDPISLPLVREIHKLNTKEIPYADNTPGDFRRGGREIGHPRRTTLLNEYWDIEQYMGSFLQWINDKSKPNIEDFSAKSISLVKSILTHYYLTEIHPFGDGNGRTARAIEALMLLRETGINRVGFYAMANHCYRERGRYIELLGRVYAEENVTPFVTFCLQGLLESQQYVYQVLTQRIQRMVYMDYLQHELRYKRINKRESQIVSDLVMRGEIDHSEFIDENRFGVSLTTQYRYLSKLRKLEFIKIVKDPDNPKKQTIIPNYELVTSLRLRI